MDKNKFDDHLIVSKANDGTNAYMMSVVQTYNVLVDQYKIGMKTIDIDLYLRDVRFLLAVIEGYNKYLKTVPGKHNEI